jgi:glutamate synthase (NADPH/NADH) large chain
MTGGRVVVLGETGRNFGAGMSGGIAYVWDPDCELGQRVNPEMVELEVLDESDIAWLVPLLEDYVAVTKSPRAASLLRDKESTFSNIIKVMPRDYRRVLEATQRAITEGLDVDHVIMESARG